ncbi:MAG: ETC complex I subunit [Alphaproteobacteria bacterium]
MDVRIYRPARTATQSGLSMRKVWILECDYEPDGKPDPLMGWPRGTDTRAQLRLKFKTCERAIFHAKKNGWNYTVFPENPRRVKPRNFADNFKYTPEESQS